MDELGRSQDARARFPRPLVARRGWRSSRYARKKLRIWENTKRVAPIAQLSGCRRHRRQLPRRPETSAACRPDRQAIGGYPASSYAPRRPARRSPSPQPSPGGRGDFFSTARSRALLATAAAPRSFARCGTLRQRADVLRRTVACALAQAIISWMTRQRSAGSQCALRLAVRCAAIRHWAVRSSWALRSTSSRYRTLAALR